MRDDKRRPPGGPRNDRAAGGFRGARDGARTGGPKVERTRERPRGEARLERGGAARAGQDRSDGPRDASRPMHRRPEAKFKPRSSEARRPHRPDANVDARPASRPEAKLKSRPEPRSERKSEPRSEPRREHRPEPRVQSQRERAPEPTASIVPAPRPKFEPLDRTETSHQTKSRGGDDSRGDRRSEARPDFRKERRHENRAKRWSERALAEDGPVRIFGIHPVEAALLNPNRKILRLVLTENAEKRLEAALAHRGVPHESTHPRDLDRLLGEDTVHQGALLETEPLPEPSFEELADLAMKGGPLVVLDQVTDPHNVGAILRSAAAFGASGLIMTRRNSPPLSGVLAKSASGALEHVPVALVPNLAQALGKLGDLAILRIGLDGESETLIEDQDLKSGIALVFGAEGKGLRRLTQELCDRRCCIVTGGALQSLNVSNAAAIALHAAAVQRRRAP